MPASSICNALFVSYKAARRPANASTCCRIICGRFPHGYIVFETSLVTDCVLCSLDPFAEADEDTGETKQSQNYIHIRIQR